MKRLSVFAVVAVLGVLLVVAGVSFAGTSDSPLFEASLRNGDYGSGAAVDTMPPDHGGSPHVLGIVDSPDGVTYTSTETDDRSNALINWYVASSADRTAFRAAGTVSFLFRADRATHKNGEILGDNYGFGTFNNGQGTFSARANRINNDAGLEDDQVLVGLKTHSGDWYFHETITLEYDRWYRLGFAWGGPVNEFETWVCGQLAAFDDYGSLPWGVNSGTGSATNIGLGDNHQRGYDAYGSAAGVSFADIRIWLGYQAEGDSRWLHCNQIFLPAILNNY
jgi:hypothetical protein